MGRFGFFGEEALSLIVDDLEDNEIVQTSLLALEVIDLNDFCNKILSVVDRGMQFLHFDAAQIVSLKDGSCGEFLNVGLCVEFLVDGLYANGDSTSLGKVKCLLFGHEQHKLFDRGWISMMVLMWLMIWRLFVDACDLGVFGDVDFDRDWLLMVLWRGSLILLLGSDQGALGDGSSGCSWWCFVGFSGDYFITGGATLRGGGGREEGKGSKLLGFPWSTKRLAVGTLLIGKVTRLGEFILALMKGSPFREVVAGAATI